MHILDLWGFLEAPGDEDRGDEREQDVVDREVDTSVFFIANHGWEDDLGCYSVSDQLFVVGHEIHPYQKEEDEEPEPYGFEYDHPHEHCEHVEDVVNVQGDIHLEPYEREDYNQRSQHQFQHLCAGQRCAEEFVNNHETDVESETERQSKDRKSQEQDHVNGLVSDGAVVFGDIGEYHDEQNEHNAHNELENNVFHFDARCLREARERNRDLDGCGLVQRNQLQDQSVRDKGYIIVSAVSKDLHFGFILIKLRVVLGCANACHQSITIVRHSLHVEESLSGANRECFLELGEELFFERTDLVGSLLHKDLLVEPCR